MKFILLNGKIMKFKERSFILINSKIQKLNYNKIE